MTAEQRRAVDKMVRANPIIKPGPIGQMRRDYESFMARMQVPGGIRTQAAALGGQRALLVEAVAQRPTNGTILFIHGGANMLGSPESELGLTASLVLGSGCRAFSPEYRLAPEYPFPAGSEDAFAAYRALLDSGTDPATVAVAGDSAGGGLVFAVLTRARDGGVPMPACAVTFSAGLDLTRSGESMTTKDGLDPMFNRTGLLSNTSHYLAGADPNQPLVSPAIIGDLRGFPPTLLQVGGNEVLLDDSTRMAKRLRDADVDVILDYTADVPHVFQIFQGQLDEADQALERAALFIRQRLHR